MGNPAYRVLAGLLGATTVYLLTLLFGYVFGIGTVKRHHVETASYLFAAAAVAVAFARKLQTVPHRMDLGRRGSALLPVVFIAMAAILYGNTIALGMFSDDFVLAQKALAGEWLPQESLVRPIPLGVWKVLLATTQSPAALHLLNITLHGLNAALVVIVAAQIGVARVPAIAAGLFFLAFPGSVEAVVWPAAVHDLIVAACALTFLVLAGQPLTAIRMCAAAGVLIVGLLSKESALAIPFIGLVVFLDARSPRRTPGFWILLVGVAMCAGYLALRMTLVAIPDSYAQAPSRYMIKEVLARPVATLSLPWTTAVFNAWPMIPFLWVMTCLMVVAKYAMSASKPATPQVIVRLLVAVIIAVLPLYSILFITPDLENGRYLYLSTAFWVIALVGMASVSGRLTRTSIIAYAAVLAVSVAGVQVHLAAWREAARVRERVLLAAEKLFETTPCPSVSLGGAPDNVRGAFVFRNGLSEAVAARTNATPAPAPAGTDCHFLWNGTEFERSTNPSSPTQARLSRRHP
jgi:hypothetical protein